MCPHCRAFITTDDKICPYCDTPVGPRAVDRRAAAEFVGGVFPAAQFVTSIILTANVALFLVTIFAAMRSDRGGGIMGLDGITLYLYGGANPMAVLGRGEWWRLLTAGFLHGGLMHILFNSWALMDVGAHAEQVYGPRRMTAIYLASTVGGFLTSMIFTRPSVSIGASAGLFGLIGAMIAIGVLHRSFEGTMIKEFYIRWAIYGLLWSLLPFGIDLGAHIGGMVAGFVVGYMAGLPGSSKAKESFWGVVAGILILATLYGFFQVILFLTQMARR